MSSIESLSSLFSPSGMLMSSLTSHLQTKAMKKMDMDADGSVSKTEFQAAMQKAAGKLGVELGEEEAAQMFTGFDADASGALNQSEVGGVVTGLLSSLGNAQSYMQSRESGNTSDDFASRDVDGDGVLSLAEFTGEAAQANVARVTVTTQTIEMPVNTGTGAVNTATAPVDTATAAAEPSTASASGNTALDNLMASLDSDRDGQISGEELTAFVSQIETVTQRYNETALAAAKDSGLTAQA